jgi:hypothetical protein
MDKCVCRLSFADVYSEGESYLFERIDEFSSIKVYIKYPGSNIITHYRWFSVQSKVGVGSLTILDQLTRNPDFDRYFMTMEEYREMQINNIIGAI